MCTPSRLSMQQGPSAMACARCQTPASLVSSCPVLVCHRNLISVSPCIASLPPVSSSSPGSPSFSSFLRKQHLQLDVVISLTYCMSFCKPGATCNTQSIHGSFAINRLVCLYTGVHVTLPDYYSPEHLGMIVPKTKDGRVVFMLPWLDATIAGTTGSVGWPPNTSCPFGSAITLSLSLLHWHHPSHVCSYAATAHHKYIHLLCCERSLNQAAWVQCQLHFAANPVFEHCQHVLLPTWNMCIHSVVRPCSAGCADSSSEITMRPQPTEKEIQFILDAISEYLTVKVSRMVANAPVLAGAHGSMLIHLLLIPYASGRLQKITCPCCAYKHPS